MTLGGGSIGIGVIQVLKLQGAIKIFVEPMEIRKNLAVHYGATHSFDPGEVNSPEQSL